MKKSNFNDCWQFKVSGDSMLEMRAVQDVKPVQLPYDASIQMMRSADDISGSGNGFYPEKNYVYSKKFVLSEEVKGNCVWLEFEAVYQNAFVYVNNAFAGKCMYGYSNFYVDITQFVSFEKENEIKVVVRNEVPSGRWYTGGGIYRNVHLMIANRLHICPDGVRVSTAELDEEMAVLIVATDIAHTGIGKRKLTLLTEICNANTDVASSEKSHFTVMEQTEKTYQQRLYVANPRTWSDERPELYQYHVMLMDGEEVIDEETGNFGIRKLQLDPVRGLQVNGKSVKLRGGCIHHDNGIIGANEFPYAAEYRVRKLKEAGYNALRSSHYPLSRAMLDACDKHGMYVMDEYSDVWTSSKVCFDYAVHMTEWWEHDISNMIKKDYNHPSVIMYSIGNEIAEAGNDIDVQWGKKFADKIRALDNTRYITNGLNTFLCIKDHIAEFMQQGAAAQHNNGEEQQAAAGEINQVMSNMANVLKQLNASEFAGKILEEAASQIDIMGYNYAAVRYEMDRENYPNRIIVGTETNGKELDDNWELVEKYPNIIGDFVWSCWDYIGEAGIGKLAYEGTESANFEFYAPYPCRLAYCGDYNIIGDRRPVSYWREIIWGKRTVPYIAVQPVQYYGYKKKISQWTMSDAVRSWNYRGWEGKPVIVEVYTNAEEVQLLLNGKEIARQAASEEKKNVVLFDVIYQPGTLAAVAYKGGNECGTDILVTASEQVSLKLKAEELKIPADGTDIRYIDVELSDAEGNLNPEVVKEISVEIEGADIQGFGSGAPEYEGNYFDTKAATFEGRLRAAVRGNGTVGDIVVTFRAEGCQDAKIRMQAY